MAYTYDEFVNAAKNAGMYDSFSQEDLTTAQASPEYGFSLLKLQQDAGKATTEEQKLLVQEAVNQLRNTYKSQALQAGNYSYGRQNDYQKLLDGITGQGSFSYDHRQDPTYGAVKESWISDGDRTMDRLMSTPTVPQTSWADNAAQQANNYYDTKLNDQIPGMHQNAYEEYLQDLGMDLSKFGAVSADRNFQYTADQQQKKLDQTAAQQKFDNDMVLHKTFGEAAPVMPDLDNLTPGTDTKYTYGKDTEYQAALDNVVNQEDFSYDHRQDPLYGSLRKTHIREGDRTAADTLAEINARTGGVASSYGVRAAADAGNAFNEALNGQIPGLRQNAYQEYLGDFDVKLQGLEALAGDRDFDYGAWLQNYEMEQAAKQQEFQNALALYEEIGLTPEIAAALGIEYVPPKRKTVGTGPRWDDGTAEEYLNALVAGQYSDENGNKTGDSSTYPYNRGTKGGQSSVKQKLNTEINAALKAGAITRQEAAKLRETYVNKKNGTY